MRQFHDIKVQFFFKFRVTLTERNRLKFFIAEVLHKRGNKGPGSLRIIFCSDEELLRINKEYLNHDYYTDIITFPFSGPSERLLDAEIYISVPRIQDNARTNSCSVQDELHRVIFHGVLHLCGYNDKTIEEQIIMRKQEDILLAAYN